ncbi:MAG: 2-dehydropantoate 2-reductase [Chloroflexota bacterium]
MSRTAAAGGPAAPRRVAVLGAGAVGTLLGGLLASAGDDVVLVDPRVAPDAGDEIVIHQPDGRRVAARVRRAASPTALAVAPDLAILAVKTFDIAAALGDLRTWPGTPVLTIQNGVGAEDLVASARPGVGHVAGSLTAPVERPGAHEVRWRGRGGLGLAPVAGSVGRLVDELVAAFTAAGLPARRLGDARAMKWSKLVANLVGNALSALADRDPGAVYADPALFDLERRQLLEALAVMRAQGLGVVALPGANVPLLALGVRLPAPLSRRILARIVGGARGGKSPSLRLHLRGGAGGPSEVAWLNGAVGRAGAALGVPTPVNDALAELVDAAAVDPDLAATLAAEPARIVDLVARPPRRLAP